MKPTEFLNELSNDSLASYKKKAGADATAADKEGNTKKADKRFSGIVKATKKQFDNDSKSIKENNNFDKLGFNVRSDILWPAKLFETKSPEASEDFRNWLDTQRSKTEKPKEKSNCILAMIQHTFDEIVVMYGDAKYIGETETHYILQVPSGTHEYSKKNQIVFNSQTSFDHFITFLHLKYEDADVKITVKKDIVTETTNNYHANRTGFSRPTNHRDDERHDLDTPKQQVWGLKINGKVWSKGGVDVTFTNKEAALNARNSILKTKPDLEIGLVTKGGVAEELDENLHKWFKEKWVRFGPDGKIRGACARGDDSEGKPKCLPQAKAHALGKKGRKYAGAKKRREDPNPERSGKAINVNTKKKSNESVVLGRDEGNFVGDTPVNLGGVVVKNLGIGDIVSYFGQKAKIVAMSKTGNTSRITIPSGMGGVTKDVLTKDLKRTSLSEEELDEACWKGYHKEGNKELFGKTVPNCVKNTNEEHSCPHCGGEMVSEELMNEKKDACYYKVKSRYKVWPSAYASGALVKCRKKGANNWGNGGKKLKEFAPGNGDDGSGDEDTLRKYAKMWYNGDLSTQQQIEQILDRMGWEIGELESEEGGAFVVQAGDENGDSYIGFTADDLTNNLEEKWTKKYKDSINCSNPKGFSQKAHCAGKQKNESAIMSGLNHLDEGWKEKLGAAALAGSMALGAGAANARVTPDGQGGFTGGLKPTATVVAPATPPTASSDTTDPFKGLVRADSADRQAKTITVAGKEYRLVEISPTDMRPRGGQQIIVPQAVLGERSIGNYMGILAGNTVYVISK